MRQVRPDHGSPRLDLLIAAVVGRRTSGTGLDQPPRGYRHSGVSDLREALERARAGGPERHREKSAQQGKLPVRERIARLVDPDSFAEEALLANWEEEGFGADGVVTGMATIGGRPVCVMANDPTVKAGSGGPKTVEKIIRTPEQAPRHEAPIIYLGGSPGPRSPHQ